MNNAGISPKEFLTQAEEKYGKNVGKLLKLAMWLGGAGLLYVTGPTILAFLTLMTSIVGQAIVLGAMLAVVFTLYMFLTNPSVKAMISDHFHGLIRSMIKAGVKINPIDRLQAYADEYLQGKMDLVQGTKDFIRGKQNWHKSQVEQKSAQLAEFREQAAAYKKRSCLDQNTGSWKNTDQGRKDRDEFRLLSDQIMLLQASLARLEKMGARYELFMTLLEKYERAFDISIRRIRNTVQIVTDEYEASQNMAAATQAMSGVMEGTDQRTKLFNMTLEFVSQEIAANVAQVENFFDRTRSIIASTDINSDVAEERLLQELSSMGDETDKAISTLEANPVGSVSDMVNRVQGVSGVSMSRQASASMPSGDRQYSSLLNKLGKRN